MTDYTLPENRRLIDEPTTPYGVGYFQKIIGQTDTVGFFSFNSATLIEMDRCDTGWWGPMSFHEVIDGQCNCGNIDSDSSTTEVCVTGVASLNTVKFTCPFYSAPPIGYICYQELLDPSVETSFCRHHWNANSRTLQELFKLMLEWSDCYLLLSDQSRCAETANSLLEQMEMPFSIETWIRENVPDQAVARFLLGDVNARDRAESIPDMTDEMSNWLWGKVINMSMTYGPGSFQPPVS